MPKKIKIKVQKDGPYIVTGSVPLQEEQIVRDKKGFSYKWKTIKKYPLQETYLLCRCGKSKTKPFCDQSHLTAGCDCAERASKTPFKDSATEIEGPEITLKDAEPLCVHAGFCDRAGGIWELTRNSDKKNNKETAIEEAFNCPSGRLVEMNKKGEDIEPDLEPSISVTRDAEGIPGPLWIKGRIPIEGADGKVYEIRNRVTLCRCGRSGNKPFCDASHYKADEKKINPVDDLGVEHSSIRAILKVLGKINNQIELDQKLNYADLTNILIYFKEYIDKCHYRKEEDGLFANMKSNCNEEEMKLIKVLVAEHNVDRDLVKKMSKAIKEKNDKAFLENSKRYIALINQHIIKENQNLFPKAKDSLSSTQLKKAKEVFDDIDENIIGMDRHKELRSLFMGLRKKYL